MFTTVHLHGYGDSAAKTNAVIRNFAAASADLAEEGVNTTLNVTRINPDEPDEPNYEEYYNALKNSVIKLAVEWEESGTQYKHKMAEQLRFRTGLLL